jgi:hypothetical protein
VRCDVTSPLDVGRRRVRQVQQYEGGECEHGVPEGGIEAVPGGRPPHLEPFPADDDEAAEEQGEDHQQTDRRGGPGRRTSGAALTDPQDDGRGEDDRRRGLPDDHGEVGGVLQARVGDRAPHDPGVESGSRRCAEVGGVHVQYVLDERLVGGVVGDVAKRDEQHVEAVEGDEDEADELQRVDGVPAGRHRRGGRGQ